MTVKKVWKLVNIYEVIRHTKSVPIFGRPWITVYAAYVSHFTQDTNGQTDRYQESTLVHFRLKMWHLVAIILIIFLIIHWPDFVSPLVDPILFYETSRFNDSISGCLMSSLVHCFHLTITHCSYFMKYTDECHFCLVISLLSSAKVLRTNSKTGVLQQLAVFYESSMSENAAA